MEDIEFVLDQSSQVSEGKLGAHSILNYNVSRQNRLIGSQFPDVEIVEFLNKVDL